MTKKNDTPTTEQMAPILLHIGNMSVFNFALYQNGVKPIHDIKIQNTTGTPIEGLSLRITSDFDFFEPFEVALPPVPSGKPIGLSDPPLHIKGNVLADMNETVRATVTVEICLDGEPIAGERDEMNVLAYDQWNGMESFEDLLPAFVLPNHPAVAAITREAAERLREWGKLASLEGYQSGDPNRVRDMAAAVYAAIQKSNIVYANPPASFMYGQRIRTPEVIMEQKMGTCLDMTLLYAACLESIGLHPVLMLQEGHIYAGVWLTEKCFEDVRVTDPGELIKRVDNGADELTFVECTAMCSGRTVDFETAETAAKLGNLRDVTQFRYAIDVHTARRHGILPVASRVGNVGSYKVNTEEIAEDKVTAAPKELEITIQDVSDLKPKKIQTKRELWESKLLDLSLRNMLLNLRPKAGVAPLMTSHIDELEDALADGEEFRLQPVPEWILSLEAEVEVPDEEEDQEPAKGEKNNDSQDKKDSNDKSEEQKEKKPKTKRVSVLKDMMENNPIFELTDWDFGPFQYNEKFRSEFRSHRVYTYYSPAPLERELTKIYRAARSAKQENGVSSLYLAIGMLRWFPDPAGAPCYAPLILIPIEIIRKSANQGYALQARDEDPHFNTTLLEMLRQVYEIEIGGLEPLPSDEHGVDIKKVFAIVRSAVFKLPGWDVVESSAISNFSFAQFAMWNDIHGCTSELDNSKIVRSLMKGHVDWDVRADEDLDEDQPVFLPISVDDTQLKAIKMAAAGKTFVLHGPPGTGKSQTITAMIANLMAQGKRVLFVAEKMAALSVVDKRLTSLGVGDFCLELHSDKANKKQVLTQLETAMNRRFYGQGYDYEEVYAKTEAVREKLDAYAVHLHQKRESGYSLHDLIDKYESLEKTGETIYFDQDEAGALPATFIRGHEEAIADLSAAGDVFPEKATHPLRHVLLSDYSAEIRHDVRPVTKAFQDAAAAVRRATDAVAGDLGVSTPSSAEDYRNLMAYIKTAGAMRESASGALRLLGANVDEIQTYYDNVIKAESAKALLLQVWEAPMLDIDVDAWMQRHHDAESKLFGKGSAKAAVTRDLQVYCKRPLTFEMIPTALASMQEYQQLRQGADAYYTSMSSDSKAFVKEYPDNASFKKAYDNAKALEKQAERFPGGLSAIDRIGDDEKVAGDFDAFKDAQENYKKAKDAFCELFEYDKSAEKFNLITADELCRYILEHTSTVRDWALYNKRRSRCMSLGLRPVVMSYEDGMPSEKLLPAYRMGLIHALIEHTILEDDVLSAFSAPTFQEAIRQFKELDKALIKQARNKVDGALAANIPSPYDGVDYGREFNILRKAIGNSGRGIAIRELFSRIPHLLPYLAPCMLMSPNSVAQYLDRQNDMFDVVIFDEASQLPTCKAVGALLRAKDAVIVGDPKQMPPTSFFAGSGPEVNDFALEDLDSILDDALALGIPSQYLQWHYRSTHESLIAFSNNEFYDNKMFTFPSANDRERHVTARFVKGVYKKGVNIIEAQAVVEEVLRRYKDPLYREQSIGIVTFNVKQQALIEDLLGKQYELDPGLDAWANSGEDPLFVKNLENVQGDERDAILFSIGYGPNENGRIYMNFGPINQVGGGKRLNVAFSRSRISMTIFASMHASDLRIASTTPEGVIAFRDFLAFAEGHELPESSEYAAAAKKISREGICRGICEALRENGYECQTMIGHSDFRVDIAVVDPNEPTKYLMGIMLDGEGYKRTTNTRDREIAQFSVLNNLGWKLRRVWTMDWWDHREQVVEKLLGTLAKLKADSDERMAAKKAEEEKRASEMAKVEEELAAARQQLSEQADQVMQEELVIEDEEMAEAAALQEFEDALAEAEEQALAEAEQAAAEDAPAASVNEQVDADPVEQSATVPEKQASTENGEQVSEEADNAKEEPAEESAPLAEEETAEELKPADEDPEEAQDIVAEKISYILCEYETAQLPVTGMSIETFASKENKEEAMNRARAIVESEGPIPEDFLIRKLLATYEIYKSKNSVEAAVGILKAAKIKRTKYKGTFVYWADRQDPKAFYEVRCCPDRTADELTLQEVKNAICYAVQEKGMLDKDAVIKEASVVLGYKRLGNNLAAVMDEGLKLARANKEVQVEKGEVSLMSE